jgi:ADP-ribose pyrophosphatase YjhB (NUDIX family)
MRLKVRGIAIRDGRILVQRPTGDPGACYAFIGGSYEVGETMAERVAKEYTEETNARVLTSRYLFVIERPRRVIEGRLVQALEHFFEVTLDREDIESREAHLAQHWLSLSALKSYDLRPWIVRDLIAEGRVYAVRHLLEPADVG